MVEVALRLNALLVLLGVLVQDRAVLELVRQQPLQALATTVHQHKHWRIRPAEQLARYSSLAKIVGMMSKPIGNLLNDPRRVTRRKRLLRHAQLIERVHGLL